MMSENRLRVLVVDDEPAIRRYLKTSLGAEGYTIGLAANGQEALTATAFRPDLIILDLGLPDMDGLEALHRLRAFTVVPIIILSVREEEGVKVRALDAGADDYLTKPFGTGELLARHARRHAPAIPGCRSACALGRESDCRSFTPHGHRQGSRSATHPDGV